MSDDQMCRVCRGEGGQHKFTCPERGSERVTLYGTFVDAAEVARLTRLLARRDATIARVKAARAEHPACEVRPEDGPITCGWKRAVRDIDLALETPEQAADSLATLVDRLEPLLVAWRTNARGATAPRTPAEYAALAALYAHLDAAGDRRPVTKLARMFDVSPVTLAQRVREARVSGLLESTRQGVSGGVLTEKGAAVLDAALEEADDAER